MAVPHRSRTEIADKLADKMERLRVLELDTKRLQKEVLDARVIRKEIFKLANTKPEIPLWMQTGSKAPKHGPGLPVAVASDWHFGETISSNQIGGVNSYNIEIAHKRARAFFDGIVTLLKRHMVTPKYEGIVLCLGGDMISGSIHAELLETNSLSSIPAVLDLFGVLIAGIDQLIREFGSVVIPCVTGNHGRMTLKMPSKERCHTNFDWLLYQMLEKHFESNTKVIFLISDGVDQLFKVYNHRFLLTHGDTLGKGGDGVIGCLGPIVRGDHKTRSRNGQIGQEYDTLICGHYHQLMFLSRVIVNGSLCGYGEFAANTLRAPFEVPRQALFCIHPEHGITYQMPILVEPNKLHATTDWVSWKA